MKKQSGRVFGNFENWRGIVVSLSALVALTSGCAYGATEEEEFGEPVAEAFEPFSGLWGYGWQVTSPSATTIGTNVNRTCFLAGVSGNLVGGNGNSHGAEVVTNGSNYELRVRATRDHKVRGDAFCIGTSAGRTSQVHWTSSSPAKSLGVVTPQRRCFLTGVMAADNGFGTSTDNIRVWNDGANWYLGGSTSQGWISGSARCVDVTADHGGWAYFADPGGNVYGDLAANTNPGGVACWLTRIEGRFATDSWTDGVRLNYEHGLLQWFLSVTNNKKGWSYCYR